MNMINKIRKKFIIIAITSVTLIIVGALSLVTIIAYVRINAQIDSFLVYITQNDGRMYDHKITPLANYWFNDTSWTDDTPDFPYQLRYFSVLVNNQGYVEAINIKNIAAFTQNEAIAYAKKALESNKPQGFLKKDRANYAYKVTKKDDGSTLIVIMDCTRDMALVQDFINDSITLGFSCIILFILCLIILSNQAIKPFVHNIENQKRFITNASHELKTPLAIISANTEAIELINGKNEWTQNIIKQIRRLSNLINELVTLSKMSEDNALKIDLVPTNISEITTDIAKSFEQVAIDEEKTLTYNIPANVLIIAESKCLYNLINILVDNAVKYCDDNKEINILLSTTKKNVCLTITNDYIEGKNIDYNRFFERFYREDTSHSNQKRGYGIGLSLAEELTKLLKSNLSVSYANGKISFTLKFNI